MAYRHVTVFGGSGFIGRHLVRRLASAGALVRVAVRDPENASFLLPLGDVGQVVPGFTTITDDASVAKAVEGADWVINLVGVLYERGARTFKAIHVDGAARVARAARAAGVKRLVHVSALGADAASASAYARSKDEGEKAVLAAFSEAVIMRPGVVFGPEDDFFNRFGAMARLLPILPVFSNKFRNATGPRFQPVYVGDVADSIMKVLGETGHEGKVYELGGPTVYTMREIMELVLRVVERHCMIVPMPFWLGKLQASALQYLPNPPLTPDQMALLAVDNVLSGKFPGLVELGVAAAVAEVVLPTYLSRYRVLHRHTILRGI